MAKHGIVSDNVWIPDCSHSSESELRVAYAKVVVGQFDTLLFVWATHPVSSDTSSCHLRRRT